MSQVETFVHTVRGTGMATSAPGQRITGTFDNTQGTYPDNHGTDQVATEKK